MSYDIYIGEAHLEAPDPNDGPEENCFRVDVESVVRTDAPSFPGDKMTGQGNSRHPGYSQWTDFCRKTGLYELFFNKSTGLMRKHPGAFRLLGEHQGTVAVALECWMRDHPGARPGWCECPSCNPLRDRDAADKQQKHEDLDGDLARLIWLDWWIRWAMANCDCPTIYNH